MNRSVFTLGTNTLLVQFLALLYKMQSLVSIFSMKRQKGKLDRLVMKALAITTNLQLKPSTEKRKTGAKVTRVARCSLPSSSRLITMVDIQNMPTSHLYCLTAKQGLLGIPSRLLSTRPSLLT